MFVLLDENLLSRKLKQPFVDAGHTVHNVDSIGWRGTKDHNLLTLAEEYQFDIFITADKNLPYQQNIDGYQIRIIVLNAKTTKPDYLLPFLQQACQIIQSLLPGSITLIDDDLQLTDFQP